MALTVLAGLFFWTPKSTAAEIEVLAPPGAAPSILFLHGIIEIGDDKTFESMVASHGGMVVKLESPGGQIAPALSIGEIVRTKKLTTYVPPAATCASACGIIWMGGARRVLSPAGKVGFHASYVQDPTGKHEFGASNAVVGAYYSRLGLSDQAIFFLTMAPPDKINWLTEAEGQRYGISFEVGDNTAAIPKVAETPPPEPSAAANPISPPPPQAPEITKDQIREIFRYKVLGRHMLAERPSDFEAMIDALYADAVSGEPEERVASDVNHFALPFLYDRMSLASDAAIGLWVEYILGKMQGISESDARACVRISKGQAVPVDLAGDNAQMEHLLQAIFDRPSNGRPHVATEDEASHLLGQVVPVYLNKRPNDVAKLKRMYGERAGEVIDNPQSETESKISCYFRMGVIHEILSWHGHEMASAVRLMASKARTRDQFSQRMQQ